MGRQAKRLRVLRQNLNRANQVRAESNLQFRREIGSGVAGFSEEYYESLIINPNEASSSRDKFFLRDDTSNSGYEDFDHDQRGESSSLVDDVFSEDDCSEDDSFDDADSEDTDYSENDDQSFFFQDILATDSDDEETDSGQDEYDETNS